MFKSCLGDGGGSHYMALAGLELAVYTRLTSNSWVKLPASASCPLTRKHVPAYLINICILNKPLLLFCLLSLAAEPHCSRQAASSFFIHQSKVGSRRLSKAEISLAVKSKSLNQSRNICTVEIGRLYRPGLPFTIFF